MPFLEKAFFTVDLRTGSEYIGWVCAVIYVCNSLLNVYQFTNEYSIHSYLMFDIIVSLSQFLISVCLIRAAKDNNRKLLVPFLIGTIINIVLRNLLTLVIAINSPAHAPYHLLGLLVLDTVGAYLWACVYSFYQTLSEAPALERETVVIEDGGTTRI